jgi:benzoyl-CoA reductase subunit C
MRAGMVLPVEAHSQLLEDYLAAAEAEDRPMRDNCRIVLQGSFCEQPPLSLVRSIEYAGCYIVDDDYMLVSRWLLRPVPAQGDPIANLAETFLKYSTENAAKYEPDGSRKGRHLIETVRRRGAEGVIFASPSFCDPALLDRPMMANALTRENIPHISFKYAENSGQMQPIREQAGTFADSIKLWSEP